MSTEQTKKTLQERLNVIEKTENQIKNERINVIEGFLTQRAKLESDDLERQLEFLKEKHRYLLEAEHLYGDERIAMEEAVQRAIQALQEETARKAIAGQEQMIRAQAKLFGGLSKLLGAAGKENRAFFMLSRKMAIVQAGINTALSITNALASFPGPVGIVKAIAFGMKGAAQKAKIVSSMIPSAETGGRFVVPQSRGVDNSIMRVNPGETVDITPRGMTGRGEIFNSIGKPPALPGDSQCLTFTEK